MSTEQKTRLYNLIKKTASVLCLGIGYLILISITKKGIPCLFFLLTNKYCPGCGISRMFVALSKLDFTLAARYNLLVLCLLPFGIWIFLRNSFAYVKTGTRTNTKFENFFYIIAFVITIIFTILWNTSWIPFLQIP